MSYPRSWTSLGMILTVPCLLVACAATTVPESGMLVIHSTTIIDGRDGSRKENATIVIERNRDATNGMSAYIGNIYPACVETEANRAVAIITDR